MIRLQHGDVRRRAPWLLGAGVVRMTDWGASILVLSFSQSSGDVLGEVLGVPPDAGYEARSQGVQKAEPEEVRARVARDAPSMNGVAGIREEGSTSPTSLASLTP
jgi:hypothetical protein